MRLTLEAIHAIHRPLKRIGGFTYWYKDSTQRTYSFSRIQYTSTPSATRKLPLVFIHGLGQGLIHYLNFIRDIATNRDVFLLELSYISSRVGEHVPESKEVADALSIMLQEHNYSRAIFMGHSFGTFTVNWCMKFHPDFVHSVMLIDPVTLLVCYPTTCHTF
uniref:Abhydrolase domain-containing protein 4 n=1 Tax=Lygus hesperus TaxID=30085 RepID=A0A0A9X6W4_LYGHE